MHAARGYQQSLIDAYISFLQRGGRNGLVVLPTGGGKSFILARIAAAVNMAVCAIAHRGELVSQISLALAREGVRHKVIGPDALARQCTLAHLEELDRDYVQPNSRIAVAGVDSLVKMSASDPWFAQVGLWIQDECFPAGTPVDGRPIETIRVGDTVSAFNETTGAIEPRRVVRLFKNAAPAAMVRLTSGGRTLVATPGHPFWTQRGWVPAGQLDHDDTLLQNRRGQPNAAHRDRGGRSESRGQSQGARREAGRVLAWARLDRLEVLKRGDRDYPVDGFVYNIEVDGLHTYLANDVVVHNCHHLLADNKWGKAAAMFPNARGLGVTATPVRADGKGLGRHADGLMDEMFIGPTMRELIAGGFLTDYRIFAPPSDLDLSQVGTSDGGDYSPRQLSAARQKSHITGDVVQHYLRIAPGKLGVTFDVDVESATQTAAAFRAAGIPAEIVSGKTPAALRSQVLRRFRNREVLQLVNVDLFGEGFDLPAIEVVSMARPTQSYALFAQQLGRGLRRMPGKSHAIILDHVGNTLRHGLPDSPRVWSLDRRERRSRATPSDVIPTRVCLNAQCMGVYERVFNACPYCGHVAIPAGRSTPEQVDGDLHELDADVLARMRGEISRIDGAPAFPRGAADEVVGAIKRNHWERQQGQARLRAAIALWSGWQHTLGRQDPESYRRFYFRYGIDVASAQALGLNDSEALAARIQNDLNLNNVREMT